MKNYYPLKHWLSVLLVGPLFWLIYETVFRGERLKNVYRLLGEAYMLELLFSLPAFILYLIIFYLLKKKTTNEYVIKLTLNIFTIIVMFITFKLIDSHAVDYFFIPYTIAIILCSLIFKTSRHSHNN
jgi:hypothetical protein